MQTQCPTDNKNHMLQIKTDRKKQAIVQPHKKTEAERQTDREGNKQIKSISYYAHCLRNESPPRFQMRTTYYVDFLLSHPTETYPRYLLGTNPPPAERWRRKIPQPTDVSIIRGQNPKSRLGRRSRREARHSLWALLLSLLAALLRVFPLPLCLLSPRDSPVVVFIHRKWRSIDGREQGEGLNGGRSHITRNNKPP